MNTIEIIEDICEIRVSDYALKDKLKDILQWDSFAILNFLAEAENRYQCNILIEEIVKIETIEDLIQLLDGKRQEE